MKHKTLLALMVSTSLLAGCGTMMNNPFQSFSPVAITTQTNSNIISDLVVLNKNEIAASRLAMKKAVNPSVRNYAALINREHNKNLQKTLAVSRKIHAPQEMSALSRDLQAQGQRELANLNTLSGSQFDRAYIDAMIRDHQNALNILDRNLIPNSTNPVLTNHLKATRDHIVMHLQKAKAIQAQLR